MTTSFSVVFILLSVVLGIANGFVVSPSASLNVRRQSQTGGLQMLFGGGGKKKAGGGIVVKVQQKTGFKETELTLAGKTNLRKALMDNKIDIYPLQVCLERESGLLFRSSAVRTCAIMFFVFCMRRMDYVGNVYLPRGTWSAVVIARPQTPGFSANLRWNRPRMSSCLAGMRIATHLLPADMHMFGTAVNSIPMASRSEKRWSQI